MLGWGREEAAKASFHRGDQLLKKGDIRGAYKCFSDAEAWFENASNRSGIVITWVGNATGKRAWCAAKLGNHKEAVALYEKALAIETKLRGPDSKRANDLSRQLLYAKQQP